MNKKTSNMLILASILIIAWCGTNTPPNDTTTWDNQVVENQEERVTGNQLCDDYLEFLICSEETNPTVYKESSRKALSESLKNIPNAQLEEICTILIELDTSRVDDKNSCALDHLQDHDLKK